MAALLVRGDSRPGPWVRRPGLVLALLLALPLVAAVVCERSPADLTAEENRYLLAAENLVQDRELTFEVLPIYPILLAPAVAVGGQRGAALVNAVLLSVAALLAARRLRMRAGSSAPAIVGLLVFASVTYRYVFVVQPALLLLAAVVAALSLAYASEEPATHELREVYRRPEGASGFGFRWLAVGALLGGVVAHQPLYILLALPAAVAVPSARRRLGLTALAGGIGLTLVLCNSADPGRGLELAAQQLGGLRPSELSVGLASWNVLYLLVGRNTGVLPYFLPLLAVLGLWQGGHRRSTLVVCSLLGVVLIALAQPFNFFGGPGAVGNRWLLPWYAALWFVPGRPPPRGWLTATALLAAPLLYPTWLAPSIDLVTPDGVFRHADGALHRWLPVETTQSELPPAGQATGDRLWVRSLSLEATLAGGRRWRLRGTGAAELHIASPKALESLYLQFGPQAEPELEVGGGRLGNMVLLPDGGVGFNVEALRRQALHPMWWTDERHHNYVVRLQMPAAGGRPQTLSLTAFARDVGTEGS